MDYSNGGPVFVMPHAQALAPEEGQADDDTVTVLAQYEETLNGRGPDGPPIAAVRCRVGRGVAVLCGTHPELPAAALRNGSSGSNGGSTCDPTAVGDCIIACGGASDEALRMCSVADQLEACKDERAAFMHMLLAACCTGWRRA